MQNTILPEPGRPRRRRRPRRPPDAGQARARPTPTRSGGCSTPRLEVMRAVRHDLAAPGRRHRRRRRAVQRRLLPPLPVEGRAGRRASSTTAPSGCASYLDHQMAKEPTPGGPGAALGRGRALAGRRRHRGDDPRGALERRQRRVRAGVGPPLRQRAARPRSCTSRSRSSAAPTPSSTPSLAAHAAFGRLTDHLWQGDAADAGGDRPHRRLLPRRRERHAA